MRILKNNRHLQHNTNTESNILTASNDKLTCCRNFCLKLSVSSLKRYRKRSISCWRNQRLRSSLQRNNNKKKPVISFLIMHSLFLYKLDVKPSEHSIKRNADFGMESTNWRAWKRRQETFRKEHSIRKDNTQRSMTADVLEEQTSQSQH